jgi:hypothetical protein
VQVQLVRLEWSPLLAIVVVLLAACSRGPAPPSPVAELTAEIVAVVADGADHPPIVLADGSEFPPGAAEAERIWNWPAERGSDEGAIREGSLLLGGQRDGDRWWYQIAGVGGPTDGACWLVVGGSWDRGDSVWFSSGLLVPKAPGFEVRLHGHEGIDAFPGHQDDAVCLSADGRAIYFDRFIGR